MIDSHIVLQFLNLTLLLCLSFFFSASETALFSLSAVRIRRLQEEKRKGALLIGELLKEPREVLATILLANLFVNVFSTSLAESASAHFFGTKGLEISIVMMSFVILVFCEILPKVLAVSRSIGVSLQVAPALRLIMVLITPLRFFFLKVANTLVHLFVPKDMPGRLPLSPEQLKTAIGMGRQEKILSEEEAVMLGEILDLKHRSVSQIMTARDKIFAIELHTSLSTVYGEIRKRRLSRIPVFDGDLDHVVGVLYAKDIIMQEILELTAIQVFDLLRKPYFVPETLALDQLLKDFQAQRLHMALVLDKDQRLSGLVTLDDLMEAVVGPSMRPREERR